MASREITEEELARFKAYKERLSARHPLFSTEGGEIGKPPPGFAKVEVKPPEFGKGKDGSLAKGHVENFRYSGLQCSSTKHRFLKELDGKY